MVVNSRTSQGDGSITELLQCHDDTVALLRLTYVLIERVSETVNFLSRE